jgi:SAM-dependent methyltransferase
MTQYSYVGAELELFSAATVWKSYFRRHIEPYLGARVLEVGAGLGGTTKLLCSPRQEAWICLEPDALLVGELGHAVERGELPEICQILIGTLSQVRPSTLFDTVLYIDVLEHIEDDRGELERAAAHLKPGGHLVVLGPAHPRLFSPFDRAIGHYRRYTRPSLRALTPKGLVTVRSIYLDSVGLLASLGNRLFLSQSMPGPRQIACWDKILVRCSRLVDPLFGYSLGKSVLSVWNRPAATRLPQTESPEACLAGRDGPSINAESPDDPPPGTSFSPKNQ